MNLQPFLDTSEYLQSKFIKQTKILFYNNVITKHMDEFVDLGKKEGLLTQIEKDYQKFFDIYQKNPLDEINKLLTSNGVNLPSEYHKNYKSKLLNTIITTNKKLRKIILSESKEAIFHPWLMVFRDSIIEFLKWIPTTILIIGFIKALILSQSLKINLSILFSLQDYWDYGISQTTGFVGVFLSLAFSFALQFYFSEYSDYRYIKKAAERYDSDGAVGTESWTKKFIINTCLIIITISCFILPYFFPDYIMQILNVLFLTTLIFSNRINRWISLYTNSILIKISILLVFVTSILNLWTIPISVNPKFDFQRSSIEIVHTIDLPSDVFYLDSSSRYHIFISANETYLIPNSNIQLIKKIKNQ